MAHFQSESWKTFNFWPAETLDSNSNPFRNTVSGDYSSLKKQNWPHKSAENILFKIFNRNQSRYYLQPSGYLEMNDGRIFASGTVYRRGLPLFTTSLPGSNSTSRSLANSYKLENIGHKYVCVNNLGHRIDYLSKGEGGSPIVVKGIL